MVIVLEELLDRVKAGESGNALDMAIEIALFQPDNNYASVKPNAAGTKLVYTTHSGDLDTCLAWDWTLTAARRTKAIAALQSVGETP